MTQQISINDVMDLHVDDFLRENTLFQPEKMCQSTICQCHNPICVCQTQNEKNKVLHSFEINDENYIVICGACYDAGYRFCIYTHNILHIDKLIPVLKDMFAMKEYDNGQLSPKIISTIDDIYQYFKMIGIDNPEPDHTIIPINVEVDVDFDDVDIK